MKRGDSIYQDFGDQGGLFADLDRKQFSKRYDPPTSKRAVKLVKIKGQLKTILEAIDKMVTSFTAHDLANHSGIEYYLISKRLSVLAERGFITKSAPDDPNFIHRNGEAVWRRTEKKAVYL